MDENGEDRTEEDTVKKVDSIILKKLTECAASLSECASSIGDSVVGGASAVAETLSDAGRKTSDRAIKAAVAQLITSMKYASQKVAEADEDLPPNTKLIVTADAMVVSLSLEVPVQDIKKQHDNSIPT